MKNCSSKKRARTQTLTLNWSNLPPKIIQSISKHLINQNEFQNFQQVCKNWRQSTTLPSILPCTSPHQILSTTTTTVYLIRRPSATPFIVTAVKPTKGSTQFVHPFTGIPFHNLPENLHCFHPCKLSFSYHVKNAKALIFSSGSLSVSEIRVLFVLVLCDGGQLGFFDCHGLFSGLSCRNVDQFDDLVVFDGVKYVLDRFGKLYRVDCCENGVKVVGFVVDAPVSKGVSMVCRRRLVVGKDRDELYLVERVICGSDSELLRVYKLSQSGNKWGWVKAEGFGNYVMFVTKDHCFFIAIDEFPRRQVPRNCIVFNRDGFPRYSNTGWEFHEKGNSRKDIFVYLLWRGTANRSYFLFSVESVMWSPPSSISHSDLLREFGKDEEVRSDSNSKEGDEESQANSNSKKEDEEAQANSNVKEEDEESQANSNSEERTAGTDGASNVAKEDILEEKVPHSTSEIPSTSEACQICTAKMKFQGVDIKFYLLPTLETVWAKHGNLIGEGAVRNKSMLACAFEVLANMVITLQNSTGRTMTDAVVEELRANLSDLQCVGLNVDWLVHTVDKVSALQKSKPFIESIMAIDEAKAEVDEREKMLLAEIAKMKQELEENRADLSSRIPFTEPVDLDECLGIGLC